MAKTTSYQKDLIESLKDPCEAAAYLNAAIEEGDRAVVHYTGLLWSTRTVFDSSWDRGAPATLTITSFDNDPNGVVPGLAEGLVGRTVGSQVIVVIPPELGYPTGQAPATIPDGSTMVFVVDILGIED